MLTLKGKTAPGFHMLTLFQGGICLWKSHNSFYKIKWFLKSFGFERKFNKTSAIKSIGHNLCCSWLFHFMLILWHIAPQPIIHRGLFYANVLSRAHNITLVAGDSSEKYVTGPKLGPVPMLNAHFQDIHIWWQIHRENINPGLWITNEQTIEYWIEIRGQQKDFMGASPLRNL